MWVLDCYTEGTPIDSNMIRKKARSLQDNLKQKGGDESKVEILMLAKDSLIILERGLA